MISDFLKPPTDNLYKFMTIFGLVLFLISVTYPPWAANKLQISSYENQRDYEILSVEAKDVTHRYEELKRKSEALNVEYEDLVKQFDSLEKRANANAERARPTAAENTAIVQDLTRLKEIRSTLAEKRKQLEDVSKTVDELLNAFTKKTIELTYKSKIALWEARSAQTFLVLSLLGAVTGLLIGRKGFNLWSTRVQSFQDAILKKQAEESAK